jgi:hypothetical protein
VIKARINQKPSTHEFDFGNSNFGFLYYDANLYKRVSLTSDCGLILSKKQINDAFSHHFKELSITRLITF